MNVIGPYPLYAILIESIQFFICVLLETLFKILTASLSADDFVTKILKSSKMFLYCIVTEPHFPRLDSHVLHYLHRIVRELHVSCGDIEAGAVWSEIFRANSNFWL